MGWLVRLGRGCRSAESPSSDLVVHVRLPWVPTAASGMEDLLLDGSRRTKEVPFSWRTKRCEHLKHSSKDIAQPARRGAICN